MGPVSASEPDAPGTYPCANCACHKKGCDVTAAALPGVPDPSAALPDLSPSASITTLFSLQVERVPDVIAVECGDQKCTYAGLASRSARIAADLKELGLRRGDTVAVTGLRTPELVAALLAVPRAGGVLLPIDPALPARRRELMASQARTRWNPRIESGSSTVIERVGRTSSGADAADLNGDVAEEAGYIFFTSGTTGTPQAVLGSHEGLSHFLQWQRDEFGVGPGDRCAQLTGLSFDVVLRDVLLPLISGATLCLPDEGENPGPDDVVPWLEKKGITLVHAVPTLAQAWLSAAGSRGRARMRIVLFAGEPLSGSLVERWRSVFPTTEQVVNLYGPTETTLATCFHVVGTPAPAGIQPLGHPLPGAQVLVLGDDGVVCGTGEPGEIVIRSPFRSLGYLNDSTETARRFVPNPHRADPSDLLFLTGDRGLYGTGGRLEFLGRLDDQVKILGVRVQPEEVTAALLAHPDVASAAVIAQGEQTEHTGLEGYYVPLSGDQSLPPSALRAHLAERLPAAMVPATLKAVGDLPTTPRGKLDRDALQRMSGTQDPSSPGKQAAPGDPLEATLGEIWAEVLDLAAVNSGDDFFELGGHSLLAARMLSRVKQRLGVRLGLRALLRAPTLDAFTESVRRTSTKGAGESSIRRMRRPNPPQT